MLDKRVYYYLLLILTILMVSSFYLSWTTEQAMGTVDVERTGVDIGDGRLVNYTVYSPRFPEYTAPFPIVLTIHGVGGSKEAMYGFNIELARRNFTVVSVDLAGHGDNINSFNISDTRLMAIDCYGALRQVQTTYDNVDPSLYGVIGHSLGFQVALHLYTEDFSHKPSGFAAIGPVWIDSETSFPGNILLASGDFDEIVPKNSLIETFRNITGNETAIPSYTYGHFENETAARLVFAPTNHLFEVNNIKIVTEAVSWMTQCLQGTDQLAENIPLTDLVFDNKNIALVVGGVSFILTQIPLLISLVSLLPRRLAPPRIAENASTPSINRTILFSVIAGTVIPLTFYLAGILGVGLESSGVVFLGGMLSTGMVISLIVTPIILFILVMVIMGRDVLVECLSAVGYSDDKRLLIRSVISSLIPAMLVIIWTFFWMYIGARPDGTMFVIIMPMFSFPSVIEMQQILIFTLLAMPLVTLDAMWIRGVLFSGNNATDLPKQIKKMSVTIILRALPTIAAAVAVLYLGVIIGFTVGRVV
ncbi:MAG: alpha/beta hydrolase family protein, partial [Candidatus Hodarchaeota archaeon]